MSDDLLMQNGYGNGFGTLMNVALLIENGCEENLARRVVKQYEDKCAQLAAQQDGADAAELVKLADVIELLDRIAADKGFTMLEVIRARAALAAQQDGVREASKLERDGWKQASTVSGYWLKSQPDTVAVCVMNGDLRLLSEATHAIVQHKPSLEQ